MEHQTPPSSPSPSNVKTIDYQSHPSAVPFHNSTRQVKALCGPVGSGKTLSAIFEFVLLCLEATVPIRGLVLRETQSQIDDSYLRTWNEWLEDVSWYESGKERLHLIIASNKDGVTREHELDLRPVRRVQEAQKFMSTEYAFIHLEEVVPAFDLESGVVGVGLQEGIFEVALLRQRQMGAHRLHIILTFNPPPTSHWAFKRFFKPTAQELEEQDFALFRQPANENARNLPKNYYKRLRQQLGPEMVQRFVDGEPITLYDGDPVYPCIFEKVHVVDELETVEGLPLVSGHDFGRTPAGVVAQNVPPGRLLILAELQKWDCGINIFCDEWKIMLKELFPDHRWGRGYGDPSGQYARGETDNATAFAIMQSKGFPMYAGAETFLARRESVFQRATRAYDGLPALLIDRSRCPLLAEAVLGAYRYPKAKGDKRTGKPLKNDYSHVANAMEYLTSGEFDVTDEDVRRAIATGQATTSLLIPQYNALEPVKQAAKNSWISR
jgi:hypothetical protein